MGRRTLLGAVTVAMLANVCLIWWNWSNLRSIQNLSDRRIVLAFSCGYLYGQRGASTALGFEELAPALVPGCRQYARRAYEDGFYTVGNDLRDRDRDQARGGVAAGGGAPGSVGAR